VFIFANLAFFGTTKFAHGHINTLFGLTKSNAASTRAFIIASFVIAFAATTGIPKNTFVAGKSWVVR
jgi:hypothetical protein